MEKPLITSNFYSQLALILTIAGSSVFGFVYLGNLIEDKIQKEVQPLIAQIEDLKKDRNEVKELLAITTDRTNINYICLNSFLEYYNRVYHKEFLRPADITERSVESNKKRK